MSSLNIDSINELLNDDDSFSSLSEVDDTDEDETYYPNISSDSDDSDGLNIEDENANDNENTRNQNSTETPNSHSSGWFEVTGQHQKQFVFDKIPGLKVNIPENVSVWYYLNLFISDDIIELIVVETNKNADQYLSKVRLTKSSRFSKWTPTDFDEIKKFIGLLMWFGLVQMPSIESYWSSKSRYSNKVASNTMSRNRFELLLRFWHFADNEKAPQGDRIYKIRDLIERVVQNYHKTMEPGEYMAIDESMVPFRGRLIFKQYIPGKAHKYGVKLFKICEANGYTHDIEVYAGKSQVDGKGLACKVVMGLSRPYLNNGRTLVTDNFYTSLPLANELLKHDTHLVGTLRSNRVKLPEVMKANLKKGQIIGRENTDGIVVAKWHDKRDVSMLSTKHTIDLIDTGKKNKNNEPIIKPKIIIDYNAGKSGIDLSDQYSSYSSPIRKSIRWYHKVVTEILLGTSVVNAFIVYKLHTGDNKNISITKFREMLVDELLGLDQPTITTDLTLYSSSTSTSRRQGIKHKFEESLETDKRNRKIRKRCHHCYTIKSIALGSKKASVETKKVNTFCSTCKVYTCIDCFNKKHMN